MIYEEEQRLKLEIRQANERAHKAEQLMESMSRKHAEQDGVMANLRTRIERLELILKVEIENAEKVQVGQEDTQKKGIFGRLLGQ